MANVANIAVETPTGELQPLSDYRGQVLLVVNVASYCGYTSQYRGLESLYQEYQAHGFTILAFPCNDFGAQEPDEIEAIAQFCETEYGISFPLFNKLHAKGSHRSELYAELSRYDDEAVNWNFEKFLVDREGEVIGRFGSNVTPISPTLTDAIENALGAIHLATS